MGIADLRGIGGSSYESNDNISKLAGKGFWLGYLEEEIDSRMVN